ncbi:hypothetical protein M3Y99_00872800 [Aphelenchoides fujianensis]|nr:hypothetical protein M3Y99_00872800 [Aphelenchoides fujianensis]
MAEQVKADVQQPERVVEVEDDDDDSSEFSVISMHEDQESVMGGDLSASHVYVAASEISASEMADARSINSQSVTAMSPMLNSFVNEEIPKELEVSAPWQPEALSGYVSTAVVADMINKISTEYQKSHEMLTSINSSLSGMKGSVHSDQSVQCGPSADAIAEQMAAVQDELAATKLAMEQLKLELAQKNEEAEAANQKAAAILDEKSELLSKVQKLEDENKNVQQLEKLLQDQCTWNKNLREQLDLTQDALALTRRELVEHKEIAEVLHVSDRASAERMRTVHEDYQNQVSSLEAILQSQYERNEMNSSPFSLADSQRSSAVGSFAESISLPSSSPVVAGPSSMRAEPHRFSSAPSTSAADFQVFLCKCLHAFPSRGALVTHKAKCPVAVEEA